jgi:quercetin 2,3-dioxygenase
MLVQTPSRIFKSDLSVWKKENSCILNEMILEKNSGLRKVTEIVFERNGSFDLQYQENSTLLIVVLYGEILINDFDKPISAEQIFTLKSDESNILNIKNNLPNEKADVLLFELRSKKEGSFFTIEDLNLTDKNTLTQISENVEYPNFIGLYDGRKEEEYSLYQKGKSIFGMVINGAFEFQNRLMETRDAIILSEIEALEFEALSENALLIFLEI